MEGLECIDGRMDGCLKCAAFPDFFGSGVTFAKLRPMQRLPLHFGKSVLAGRPGLGWLGGGQHRCTMTSKRWEDDFRYDSVSQGIKRRPAHRA